MCKAYLIINILQIYQKIYGETEDQAEAKMPLNRRIPSWIISE